MFGEISYSNATAYHEERTAMVLVRLRTELASLKRRSAAFQSLSELASHVAKAVGRSANDLRRNPAYRVLLDEYLAGQPGAVALVSGRGSPTQVLTARIRCLELQLSMMRIDKQRLERQVSTTPAYRIQVKVDDLVDQGSVSNDRMKYECTARALQLVLERSAGIYSIDEERLIIIDEAAKPSERNVVESKYARYYFEWISKNRVKNFI